MKKLLLLLVLFSAVGIHAQRLLLMGNDTSYRAAQSYLSVYGEAELASGALTMSFLDKTYRGGTIGPLTKGEIEDELRDQNRLGGWASGGIRYRSFGDTLFNRPDWGMEVAMETHMHGSALFSDAAFDLAFNGNAAYRGETLDLMRNAGRLTKFQKFGVGLFHREHFSGVRLSVVNGQFLQDIEVDEASLYTSEFADTLVLHYQGTYRQSDPNFQGSGAGNGVGVALDAVVNLPLENDKGYFTLGLYNLGHVWWSEASETYRADTTFTWTGISITDISTLNDLSLPSLEDTLYHETSTGKLQTWLPARVEAGVMLQLNRTAFWEASLSVYPDGIHLPLAQVAYAHMPNVQTLWRFTGRAGGYGHAGIGISLEKRWGPAYLTLGLPDLPGLVLRNLHGTGAYFRLGWFLKSSNA